MGHAALSIVQLSRTRAVLDESHGPAVGSPDLHIWA